MRDNYVGDIGDFAKYGLLRAVSEGRRLGIAWYMCGYAEVGGAGDGRHIGYLKNPTQWRHLDRELFDTLKKLVENDRRSVVTLQDTGILGDVVYASTLVDVAGVAVRNRFRKSGIGCHGFQAAHLPTTGGGGAIERSSS